jgi:hypothetical protein
MAKYVIKKQTGELFDYIWIAYEKCWWGLSAPIDTSLSEKSAEDCEKRLRDFLQSGVGKIVKELEI